MPPCGCSASDCHSGAVRRPSFSYVLKGPPDGILVPDLSQSAGFGRASRLIYGSTFAYPRLSEFSHGFRSCRSCYEKRNARVIPLRKEGQSSAIFSRGCPIHLPPVTGHPHALRRHSSFRLSCVPPHHREGSLLVKHGIIWPGATPVKAPGPFFGSSRKSVERGLDF